MFQANFNNYLDTDGNISKSASKEAREIASFLALLIDEATIHVPEIIWTTVFKCLNHECDYNTITEFVEVGNYIWWLCPNCDNEGLISTWQGLRWDNLLR